jgi:hypothetical protein
MVLPSSTHTLLPASVWGSAKKADLKRNPARQDARCFANSVCSILRLALVSQRERLSLGATRNSAQITACRLKARSTLEQLFSRLSSRTALLPWAVWLPKCFTSQ